LDRSIVNQTYVKPRNPVEEILVQIWSDILNIKQIGVHDNFFELGGHSLLAIKVIYKIQEYLGTLISLRCLFDRPTIAELAKNIDNDREIIEL